MVVDKLMGSNTTMEFENGNKIIIGDDCELINTKVKFNGRKKYSENGGDAMLRTV